MSKRADLLTSLKAKDFDKSYASTLPTTSNRLSFKPQQASADYLAWPMLTHLCGHEPLYGLNENRRGAMISIDGPVLANRMRAYLDPLVSEAEAARVCGGLMKAAARFDPVKCRKRALTEHKFDERNLRRYCNLPFDVRWCYWSPVRPMWNEPRPDLVAQHWPGNSFLHVRRFGRRPEERIPVYFGTALPELHLMDPDVVSIPLQWRSTVMGVERDEANLSAGARTYLTEFGFPNLGLDADGARAIWLHALAVCYSGAWLAENSDAIRTGFPRVPLPASADRLRKSVELGARLAALLDPDIPVSGVSTGSIRNELLRIAVISRSGGGTLDPSKDDLALTAGWGFAGREGVTMAGKGKIVTTASLKLPPGLGAQTHDVYLNDVAYWSNVPERVWDFTIGGYQVIKKWLSYRERPLLGRDLRMEEADYVTEMARRIAAIALLSDALDENYLACKADAWPWPSIDSPRR